MVFMWWCLYRTFALTKEQIRQSAGYQQLLTLLNDHHVLNYLRASPHTAWAEATLEDYSLNGQLFVSRGRSEHCEFLHWVCCCGSGKGRRELGEGFSRETEHTRSTHTDTDTDTHTSTYLHTSIQHICTWRGWKVFPVERGRICVLTPNC